MDAAGPRMISAIRIDGVTCGDEVQGAHQDPAALPGVFLKTLRAIFRGQE